MSKQDRQKLGILGVLVAALAVTLLLVYRTDQPAALAAVQPSAPKTSANPPGASDARIRLDLVDRPEASDSEIGKKNVFQYQQAPPPPPQPRPTTAFNQAPVPINNGAGPMIRPPAGPPSPPPPPPIPLKFQGFATVNSPGGGLIAFLADDARHYNVKVGEILLGRYRIAGISDTSVEIEDLEYSRRQTLPLLK